MDNPFDFLHAVWCHTISSLRVHSALQLNRFLSFGVSDNFIATNNICKLKSNHATQQQSLEVFGNRTLSFRSFWSFQIKEI